MNSLGCEHLSVDYGGISAISDVSFSISKGEILGLIGPNGAGKTTIVNCMSGFQRPTVGCVRYGDVDCSRWTAAAVRRAGIARTFQAGRLFNNLSVVDNIKATAFALGASAKEAASEADRLLSYMNLGQIANADAGSLAYTDQRRLSVARALVHEPAFVLLDEPAAGMSDVECEELVEIIASIQRDLNCGVLLIEHNMHVVMNICDRIHVLDGGKTLAEGTPKEIQSHSGVLAAYLGGEG